MLIELFVPGRSIWNDFSQSGLPGAIRAVSQIVHLSMQRKHSFFFLPGILWCSAVVGQAIDNTVSFRNIASDRYFRIFYENDFFSGTDRDYTQGIYIEKIKPCIRKFPLVKLLWNPGFAETKYGLAIEHDAYTPNLIYPPEIQYGDRPYAGALFLKTFLTVTDDAGLRRISVILSSGIIGPGAGGEQMQKTIHHWIDYTQPKGWHNQISNDIVLNYQFNYENELFSASDNLSLSTYGSVRAGTLSDKLTTGLSLMTGKFSSPYRQISKERSPKIQWYLYGQSLLNLVGYDATLQGGLFDRSSPYTISAASVSRLVFQYRYGLVLMLKRLYLEYYQTGNSNEFDSSIFHHTGGLQIGFGF
ncbi:MAG TPA: lipid A deacylase LpxR family protein [Puia sp.]|nr:lipid A deacylase LpxR family protein [Puia sp.]